MNPYREAPPERCVRARCEACGGRGIFEVAHGGERIGTFSVIPCRYCDVATKRENPRDPA